MKPEIPRKNFLKICGLLTLVGTGCSPLIDKLYDRSVYSNRVPNDLNKDGFQDSVYVRNTSGFQELIVEYGNPKLHEQIIASFVPTGSRYWKDPEIRDFRANSFFSPRDGLLDVRIAEMIIGQTFVPAHIFYNNGNDDLGYVVWKNSAPRKK